jgi:hypothetical protein
VWYLDYLDITNAFHIAAYRAGYADIAKAWVRIGKAYAKLEDYDQVAVCKQTRVSFTMYSGGNGTRKCASGAIQQRGRTVYEAS